MPFVKVFPAGSIAVRTPGARDGETYGASSCTRQERPVQIEAAPWPLNPPCQGRAGYLEVEDGLGPNKFEFVPLRSEHLKVTSCKMILRCVRRVEASKGL